MAAPAAFGASIAWSLILSDIERRRHLRMMERSIRASQEGLADAVMMHQRRVGNMTFWSGGRLEWFGTRHFNFLRFGLIRSMTNASRDLKMRIVKNLTRNVVHWQSSANVSQTIKAGKKSEERFVADPKHGMMHHGHAIRSRPGQYPFMETGSLASSIGAELFVYTTDRVDAYVYTTQGYAARLEFDLKRSFMLKTLRYSMGAMKQHFARDMKLRYHSLVGQPNQWGAATKLVPGYLSGQIGV